MKWAACKVTKKGEVPTGSACFLCASVVAHAFGTRTWADVVSSAKSSPDFSLKVSQATDKLQQLDGEMPTKAWLKENLKEKTCVRMKLSRTLVFLTLAEFETKYATKVAHYGPGELQIEELKDEHGSTLRGILVQDAEAPHRKLTLECEVSKQLDTDLADADEMLRAHQHSDMMQHLVQDAYKNMSRAIKAPLTEAEMQKLALRVEARFGESQKATPASGSVEQRAPLESTDTGEASGEPPSPDGQVISKVGPNLGDMLKQHQDKNPKTGKGKTRGRPPAGEAGGAAAQPKKKAKVCAELGPETGSVAGGAPSSSGTSLSSTRRVNGKMSEAERLDGQSRKWRSLIHLSDALCGIPQKNSIYQATRVYLQFKELGKLDTSECIRLKAQMLQRSGMCPSRSVGRCWRRFSVVLITCQLPIKQSCSSRR